MLAGHKQGLDSQQSYLIQIMVCGWFANSLAIMMYYFSTRILVYNVWGIVWLQDLTIRTVLKLTLLCQVCQTPSKNTIL